MKDVEKECHGDLLRNIVNFLDASDISGKTKKNTLSFAKKIIAEDPSCLTHFELSFKINKDLLEGEKVRLLSLDGKGYSYKSSAAFLDRIKKYDSIIGNKTKNNKNKLLKSLRSVAKTPVDLYFGADIKDDRHLFAFWLIFGGAKKDGKISFTKNASRIIDNIFSSLKVAPEFKVRNEDILNLGFDLDERSIFYKIYYFLNKNNYLLLDRSERKKIRAIIDLLGAEHKYWFFISERYEIGEKKTNRKKLYLEFLDDLGTQDEKNYPLMEKIMRIVGCQFKIEKLKEMLRVMEAKIVILAFESDGTMTFYIRL